MTASPSLRIAVISLPPGSSSGDYRSRSSGFVEREIPYHRYSRIERRPNRAILCHRELDRVLGVCPLYPLALDRDVESYVIESARYRVDADAEDFNAVRLDGCTALRENIHDIHRDASCQRCEQGIGRSGCSNSIAVQKDGRLALPARLESPFSFPVEKNAGRCTHLGPPFSIGARTEFPHSVQLPS